MNFDHGSIIADSWAKINELLGENDHILDNGGHEVGHTTTDGLFGNGGELDGTNVIWLQDVDFGEVVQHWKISFWWRPKELKKQRFLTITNGEEKECGKPGCNQFIIDFVHESDTQTIPEGSETFATELKMFGCHIDDYEEDAPIKLNEWNKISLEFDDGRIVFDVNGMRQEVEAAKDGISDNHPDNLGVIFKNWSIGANDGTGISGTIDKFEVTNETPGSHGRAFKNQPLWIKAVVGTTIVLFLITLCCVIYLCCCCSCCCGGNKGDTE